MSIAVSSLSKTYYNIYALTNTDTYKQNAVDASAVSQAKFNVPDVNEALEMLSSESKLNTIGSAASYAKDLYKLSQVKDSGTNDALSSSVVSMFAKDTDMSDFFGILDTSRANTTKVREALGESTSTRNAVTAYSDTVAAYRQYLENMNGSVLSILI
jgi:hypothetical protein